MKKDYEREIKIFLKKLEKKSQVFIHEKIKSLNWVFGFCFFIALALVILWTPPSQDKKVQGQTLGLDTFIPKGSVLIPVEIENLLYLKSVIGQYGVVSLFKGNQTVISYVKLIRAPKRPDHYAVLVPEELSQAVLKFQGPFKVVIQNPKQGSKGHITKAPKRRVITEINPSQRNSQN